MLYIADTLNCRIRKVTAGTITAIAGTGTCAFAGDAGPASAAALNRPSGVAVDGAGGLYVADTENCRIRKVVSGIIATVAGTGACAFSGDGGPATAAALNRPGGISISTEGDLYIADTDNCRVRRVRNGVITTLAGNGTCAVAGDGAAPGAAALNHPAGVTLDTYGNVYIADYINCRVRAVTGGTIVTLAGTGVCTFAGDGGPATAASLDFPSGVAIDAAGTLYIADSYSDRVRTLLVADAESDGVLDAVDNCPSAANATQANADHEFDNGPGIAAPDTTVPNAVADAEGDACETDGDTDNDGLPDAEDTEPLTGAGLCGALTSSDGHPNPAGGDITNDDNGNGSPPPPTPPTTAPPGTPTTTASSMASSASSASNPRSAASKPTPRPAAATPTPTSTASPHQPRRASGAPPTRTPTPTATARRTASRPTTPTATASQNFPGDTVNSAKAANRHHRKTHGLRPQRRRRCELPRRHDPLREDGQPRRRHLLTE